ncbi:MAG: hypothetical protein V1779_00450 [bacterium]
MKNNVTEKWYEKASSWLLWAAIACIIVILLALFFLQYGFYWLPSNSGHMDVISEDIFGALNAFFSGFAFAILVVALLMQRQELKLQREELKLTRDEMHSQKEEFEKQTIQFTKQNEINEKQYHERVFYDILNHFNKIVINIEDAPRTHFLRDTRFIDLVYGQLHPGNIYPSGKELELLNCTELCRKNVEGSKKDLNDIDSKITIKLGKGTTFLKNLYLNIQGADCYYKISKMERENAIYKNLQNHYSQYGYLLELYMNQVFFICKFIKNSEMKYKNNFIELFHSTLSSREIVLIFYLTFYYCKKEKTSQYYQLLNSGRIINKLDKNLLYNIEDINVFKVFIDNLSDIK